MRTVSESIRSMVGKPLSGYSKKLQSAQSYYWKGKHYRVYVDTTGCVPSRYIMSRGWKVFIGKGGTV